ncbi:hypothetical protein Q9L58_000755 [Maublancomyces gigas]|uniref:Uncharacterized protein n=1 Tax=Discina gigas TaxID=1032678 RepID=A0ABR3GWX5_9PEZI
MGINRSRSSRTGNRDKFSLARITSAKYEAKTLETLVDQDMDLLYLLSEGADNLPYWEETSEVTAVPDAILYELGILYDTPLVEDVLPMEQDVLPMEQDADWDIVSEASEWDLVSLGGFSDDDSCG